MANQILRDIALDALSGVSRTGNFNKAQMNEFIKTSILEAVGGEWNYYAFKDNQYKVFAIMAEIMPSSINASLAGTFERFAEIKDTALGDKNSFHVEDNQLFPVITSARGTQDIERSTLLNRQFSVPTSNKFVKIYAELDELMGGRVDFARMVARVSESFAHEAGLMISNAIYTSYSSVGTNYKATGAFDDGTLDDIIANVKSATGATRIQIFGETKSLKQVADIFGYSDRALDDANGIGYYGNYGDAEMIALPQAYLARTQTFSVDRNHIIIVPATEKIVKFVMEGDPKVGATNAFDRNDLQEEYLWGRMMGATAITVQEGKYGFYKFA